MPLSLALRKEERDTQEQRDESLKVIRDVIGDNDITLDIDAEKLQETLGDEFSFAAINEYLKNLAEGFQRWSSEDQDGVLKNAVCMFWEAPRKISIKTVSEIEEVPSPNSRNDGILALHFEQGNSVLTISAARWFCNCYNLLSLSLEPLITVDIAEIGVMGAPLRLQKDYRQFYPAIKSNMEELSSFLGETYEFEVDYNTFIPPVKAWLEEKGYDWFGRLFDYLNDYVTYLVRNIKENGNEDIVKAALNKCWSGKKLTMTYGDYDLVRELCVCSDSSVGLRFNNGNLDIYIAVFGQNMNDVTRINFQELLTDDITSIGVKNVPLRVVQNHAKFYPAIESNMEELSNFLGDKYVFECDYDAFFPPLREWLKSKDYNWFNIIFDYLNDYVTYVVRNIRDNGNDDIVKAALNKCWTGKKLTMTYGDYDLVRELCVCSDSSVGLRFNNGNLDIYIAVFGQNMNDVTRINFQDLLTDDILSIGLTNVSLKLVKNYSNCLPKIKDAMEDLSGVLGGTYEFESDYVALFEAVKTYLKESNHEDWFDSAMENVYEYVDYARNAIKNGCSDSMVKEALVDAWTSKKLTMTYLDYASITDPGMKVSHNGGYVGLRLINGSIDIVIGVWACNANELNNVVLDKFL